MLTLLRWAVIVVTIAVAAVSLAGWQVQRRFVAPGPLLQPAIVVVPKGAKLEEIGQRLQAAGVVSSGWVLAWGTRMAGLRAKAGEYQFQPGISAEGAAEILAEGHTLVHRLTIPEGLTVKRIQQILKEADFLAGDITRKIPEGHLLPDTLHLVRDDARDDVLARMEKAMNQYLDQAWAGRAQGLPLETKDQALVLASIVERETGLAAERPHVAAVFLNRLKIGMRLQSDPTVIYGLSDGMGVLSRSITHEDLSAQHPWNTYVIAGLPPSPIAVPGKAAIDAVLHPMDSQDLYFVANGGGGHSFAKTLTQHNQNVTHLRRLEGAGEVRP